MNVVREAFKNKAHQAAFDAGARSAANGRQRVAPYDAFNRSSAHFRKAWLAGYDSIVIDQIQSQARVCTVCGLPNKDQVCVACAGVTR